MEELKAIEIKRILMPVDFSPLSLCVLDHATAVARHFGAKILVLHVISQEWIGEMNAIKAFAVPIDSVDELLERKKRDSAERIEEIIKGSGNEALFEGGAVEVGLPAEEIVRVAKERATDLIVICTHGRSGLSHIFLGSVAEKVIRRSPCPVLSVRGQSAKG
ncbi:MAG: universal stress protein [Candidatus Altiarchaeota archaeon]